MPFYGETVKRGARKRNAKASVEQRIANIQGQMAMVQRVVVGQEALSDWFANRSGQTLNSGYQDPAFVGNAIKNKSELDFNTIIEQVSASITPTAGKQTRVQRMYDLGARVAALYTPENAKNYAFTKARWNMNIHSTTDFVVIPFVVLLENGETIADTEDADEVYFESIVDTACPGKNIILFGKEIISKGYYDSGTYRTQAKGSMNIAEFLNRYSKEYSLDLLNEENPQALEAGWFIQEETANTAINYHNRLVIGSKAFYA